MLLQKEVEDFLRISPLILPELLGDAKIGKTDYDDEMAVIPVTLKAKFDLEEVMDFLEDQMELTILYHFVPSTHTTYGHQCCAYSDVRFGHMYKIHAVTNESGLVESLTVTVFSSLEVMATNLMGDIESHEKRGKFLHKRTKQQLLVEFQ